MAESQAEIVDTPYPRMVNYQLSSAMVYLLKKTLNSEVKPSCGLISLEEEIVFKKMAQRINTVSLNDTKFASCAKKSKAIIFNPRMKYCTGDKLIIQIDMFDYFCNRKTYGGDFLKPRIYNPALNAGASGVVEDFNNGTYHVHFTLFWEGKVYISLLLYHSSEAVSAIWRARDNNYDFITFVGTFTNISQSIKSKCAFKLDSVKEVCEYSRPEKDLEPFYCIKQDNFHCESLSLLQSFNQDVSFLRSTERPLFKRENVAINVQGNFDYINVSTCAELSPLNLSSCKFGMESPFPSGFVLQNKWRPVFCKIPDFTTEEMSTCLKDKIVYFLGDSTVRQWFEYLTKQLKGLKNFNLHRPGLSSKLFAADDSKNILMYFKKHSHPFVAMHFYTVKDDAYLSDEIDHIAGGPHHVIVISIGQHFRPFPLQLFIRRAINIRNALKRLFLRSPDTKVIIKAENTREILNAERFSDFHGYIQYLIIKEVFSDLHVAIIDAWDMTIAFNTKNVHPPEHVVRNQINMFLSYICS
ncbi:NXPE family member 1-like [Phyllobates terribilis]|uniref:NXPE family member 1-like n=1 Tax=Phyllobates terribilis TaxID=111132 RepID=UPI003CCB5C65